MDIWRELRSLTKDDEGFKPDNGWRYTKYVNKSECTDIRKVWLFVEYCGERYEVIGMDCRMHDIFTSTIGSWMDNYKWYRIDELERYYLVMDEYFEPKEENKIYLSKDNVVDYARIFCNKIRKDEL